MADQTVPLINPADNRIYSVKADQADRYRDAGWASYEAEPDVRRQEIDSVLSSWKDYVPAVGMQVIRGIPFATSLVSKTVDEGTFKYLAQQSKAFEDEHGILAAGLAGAGGIASIAALSSGLGALGGALGFGAEAAAAGAEGIAGAAEGIAGVGRSVAAGAEAAGSAAEGAPLTTALARMGRSQFGEAGRVVDYVPKQPFTRALVPTEVAAETGAADAIGLGAEATAAEPQALMRVPNWTRGTPGEAEQVFTGRGSSLAVQGEQGMVPVIDGVLENPTGLMRTDQLVPRAGENIIDAEFYDPAQRLLSAGPRVFHQGAGGVAGAAEAAAGVAEGAAGLGAEAAGIGAEAAAGAEGAAGLGAQAGAVGADASVAGGAPTGGLTGLAGRLSSLTAKGSVARTAAVAAAQSAGSGIVYRIDNAAIEHALQPEGQEKLLFSANDILLDAALGAAIPVGLKGLGKVLGGTGKKIQGGAISAYRRSVMRGDALDAIQKQGRWGDLVETLHPTIGLGRERAASLFETNVGLATQGLNKMKAKYKNQYATELEKQEVLDAIRPILGPDKTDTYMWTLQAFSKKKVDLQTIQHLANRIKGQIVWKAEFGPATDNAQIRAAYEEVVGLGSTMLKRMDVLGVNDYLRWQDLNKKYSNNLLVLQGMRGKTGGDPSDLMSRVGSAAMAGAAMAGMGVTGGTAAAAALKTGSWSMLHHVNAEHIAPFAHKLGKGMIAVDRKIGNALEAGLYGVAGQASKAINPLRFDDAAATVALAASNPAKAIENLQTVMDMQGIPQELSVPVVQKQVAGLAHLHKSRPVRNDAPDVVTDDQGDPVQNQRWLDQVHTFQDPSHGISYPTAGNLRILKQFYPEILFSAQQAALQQIAKDPNLPIESKMWASQLLERPVSNITSPTFAQTLNEARKAAYEAAQPKQASGGKLKNDVQSSLSRADALQNRE